MSSHWRRHDPLIRIYGFSTALLQQPTARTEHGNQRPSSLRWSDRTSEPEFEQSHWSPTRTRSESPAGSRARPPNFTTRLETPMLLPFEPASSPWPSKTAHPIRVPPSFQPHFVDVPRGKGQPFHTTSTFTIEWSRHVTSAHLRSLYLSGVRNYAPDEQILRG